MLTIQVLSCPVCYLSHSHLVLSGESPVTLICPTYGDSYQAQIEMRAMALPLRSFGRQRSLPLAI